VDLLRQALAIWLKTFDSNGAPSTPCRDFFFALLRAVIFNFTFDFTAVDFGESDPASSGSLHFAGVLSLSHSFVIEREGTACRPPARPIQPARSTSGRPSRTYHDLRASRRSWSL